MATIEVKGTMLVDLVRFVRANKDRDWDRYLEPEDWETINSMILASNWYPYEFYRRIAYAAFVMAGASMDIARGFGRIAMKNMLNVYKNVLVQGDPAESAARHAQLSPLFFKGNIHFKVVTEGPNKIIYSVTAPPGEPREIIELFCNSFSGSLEELMAEAGAKNLKSLIQVKESSGDIILSWE